MSLNQDTPAGNHTAIVNTRRRHHNHERNNQKHHEHQKKHSKHHDEKEHSKHEDKDKTTPFDDHILKAATTNQPVFVSNLVAFSKDIPPMPPGEMDEFDNLPNDEQFDSKTNSTRRREKRTIQAQEAVCDSEHKWIRKQTARDIFGNDITVMDKILTNGGEQVSQWFYETKCSTTGETTDSCRGIDTQSWNSECLNRESYVYAMVRTPAGEEGWNWIAINTACNCALRRRSPRSRGVNRRAPYPFVGITGTER